MSDQEIVQEEKSIDAAIQDCTRNISRHLRAPLLELFVVILTIAIIAFTVVGLARIQGAENDQKRLSLLRSIDFASETLDREKSFTTMQKSRLEEFERKRQQGDARLGERDEVEKQSKELQADLDSQVASEKEAVEKYQLAKKAVAEYKGPLVITDSVLYGAGALLVIVISVFTGLYRFHLKELVKNEQYKLGFWRVRIAANNASQVGFDGEVRSVLTKGAFDSNSPDQTFLRRGKLESPLPGHPSSDFATALLNRLLEGVDVVLQPKQSETRALRS